MFTKATLQECCTAWVSVCGPCPPYFQHLSGVPRPRTFMLPPQKKLEFSLTTPSSSAMARVIILNVEPGS